MKIHSAGNRLWRLAVGLAFLSSPALALEINNNTGYQLNVEVMCGSRADSFEVSPNQVGSCPSNVCVLYSTCNYTIKTTGDGSCSGQINGGSGLQVDASNDKLSCQGYGG